MTDRHGFLVRVEREIAAPPDAVYQAWTDPASVAEWMAPEPMTVGAATCDTRVGGAFRVVMVDESGAIEHTGTYEELAPPSLLVFTWRAAHLGDRVTRVRVELAPSPVGTRMVVEHSELPDRRTAEAHRHGWESIAAKLEASLTEH